ncbi:hypothetical protein [Pseudoalteromonas sp. CAL260-MNA-CIBAN-0059]|uniref:hypothetical protein n=1 Tax=unclassified Pseudoalteromonas TaxID=194690 RepID=UPI0033235463|tara:strand:- start:1833 stop:2213 length:381 start_codon:yes stop_codon:yes gene_type:complete
MADKLYDPKIINLKNLIEIYDDNSVEIITAALSDFSHAAKKNIASIEESSLTDNLTEVSYYAHNLSGLCRFSGIILLGSLSDELYLAAKNKKKLLVTYLISDILLHWPILEVQINYIIKHYRGFNG